MVRSAVSLLAVLIVVLSAERRLSNADRRAVRVPPPELWEPVQQLSGEPSRIPSLNCPLVLSLELASRYRLTSVSEGVRFDIDADGDLEQVAWTEAGSDIAFLALDRNRDGRIASGAELISARLRAGTGNGPNALIALANEAAAGDAGALLDADNPLFLELVLWYDHNHNGVSEPGELLPVQTVLSGIGLGFQPHHRRDRHGNESRYRGFVRVSRGPGSNAAPTAQEERERSRPMYDACLIAR